MLPTVDVNAGVRLALDVLSDDAPVVLPTPAYHPQFGVIPVTGRGLWELPVSPDAGSAMFDLDRLDDRRPGHPRPVPRRPDGPQQLVVIAG